MSSTNNRRAFRGQEEPGMAAAGSLSRGSELALVLKKAGA